MTVPDPRDNADVFIGTPLRDAAVDPEPGDFLPPTNAGLSGPSGNPHGPSVVAPGIHGSEQLRGIRPGPVSSDAATQSAAETAHLIASVPEAAAPAEG